MNTMMAVLEIPQVLLMNLLLAAKFLNQVNFVNCEGLVHGSYCFSYIAFAVVHLYN